jgi:hypothetical protein
MSIGPPQLVSATALALILTAANSLVAELAPVLHTIEGVQVSVVPAKPFFQHDEPAYLVVTAHNILKEDRFVGVSGHKTRKNGPKTIVEIDGKSIEVRGVPGYLHVDHFAAFDMRICGNGYSDRYHGDPLLLAPDATASFRVVIPAFADRPTGHFPVFSRFAVSRVAGGKLTIANGPETSLLVVHEKRLANAVSTLKDALSGAAKKRHEVEGAVRAIADNPLPEHAGLIVRAIRHKWPFKHGFDWTLWYAAEKFVSPQVYEVAVAEAKKPNGTTVDYLGKTIYRNRAYLQRKDVLAILESQSPRGGFYETVFLSLVAKASDMSKLADMCARFIPAWIGHDICHATMPDRRLETIHKAFLQYPDASRKALRPVLRLGMKPGEHKPWTHAFSVGNVPRPLVFFGKWLAELKDTESVPTLEHYAKTPLVGVSNSMQREAPSLIAQIDGTEAMKSLRRLGARALRERAKLGDPVAIDALLSDGRLISFTMRGGCGNDNNYGQFLLAYSILRPDREPSLTALGDGTALVAEWKRRRKEFIDAFIKKYGFHPDKKDGPD